VNKVTFRNYKTGRRKQAGFFTSKKSAPGNTKRFGEKKEKGGK
jgi:hypothetical protein